MIKLKGCNKNVCKSQGKLNRRRSPGNDGATADGMTAAQRLGVMFLTYMDIYGDSHHNGYQHRQREELAQHAVVCPCCHRRQVAVAMMVYTLATFCISCQRDFVKMKRREYQHWQEYCQQNTCWYLSPNCFHECKVTTFYLYSMEVNDTFNDSFLLNNLK